MKTQSVMYFIYVDSVEHPTELTMIITTILIITLIIMIPYFVALVIAHTLAFSSMIC
jgi:hypothetical protein